MYDATEALVAAAATAHARCWGDRDVASHVRAVCAEFATAHAARARAVERLGGRDAAAARSGEFVAACAAVRARVAVGGDGDVPAGLAELHGLGAQLGRHLTATQVGWYVSALEAFAGAAEDEGAAEPLDEMRVLMAGLLGGAAAAARVPRHSISVSVSVDPLAASRVVEGSAAAVPAPIGAPAAAVVLAAGGGTAVALGDLELAEAPLAMHAARAPSAVAPASGDTYGHGGDATRALAAVVAGAPGALGVGRASGGGGDGGGAGGEGVALLVPGGDVRRAADSAGRRGGRGRMSAFTGIGDPSVFSSRQQRAIRSLLE